MDGAYRVEMNLSCLVFLVLLCACTQTRLTHPPRSAVEQLLFSTAADRAWERANLHSFNAKKVYVDTNYFESFDRLYVLATLRDVLSSNGALLMTKPDEAEIIIEPRSGALSTDSSDSLLGIPQLPLPIPFAGVVQTPELALLKSEKQFSTGKFALLAYDQSSRQHFLSSGSLVGRANIKYYRILGLVKFIRTTIPEKIPAREKADKP